jgi:hypothetical protein
MRPCHLFAVFLLPVIPGSLCAEPPPLWDGLSDAYHKAGGDLAKGEDRLKVLESLKKAIAAHPESHYLPYARPLAADLEWAVRNQPEKDVGPAGRLGETRLHFSADWPPRPAELEKAGDDPVARLLKRDRSVIGELIPALRDRTPTRTGFPSASVRAVDTLPRACDVALEVIEYHSRCRFAGTNGRGARFHQFPEADREKAVRRVEEWWKENKDKSVAAGIRDQIGHADWYPDKVWMAKTLIRIGEQQKTDDKEYGLKVLREMVRQYGRHHVGLYVANVLVEFGDTSAVDIFYNELSIHRRDVGDGLIAQYLCAHGGRREWEYLHFMSIHELDGGRGPAMGAVWAAVVNNGKADSNPYAIPILGLAVSEKAVTASRSHAETAVEYLQKQTGKDFGFKRDGTPDERAEATAKAQKWWALEGRETYTFDYIEKNLVKKAESKK